MLLGCLPGHSSCFAKEWTAGTNWNENCCFAIVVAIVVVFVVAVVALLLLLLNDRTVASIGSMAATPHSKRMEDSAASMRAWIDKPPGFVVVADRLAPWPPDARPAETGRSL